MKNKIIALLLCLAVSISVSACDNAALPTSQEPADNTGEAISEEKAEDAVPDEPEPEEKEDTADEIQETGNSPSENMVEDGDFSQGLEKWALYLEGGDAKIKYEDEAIKVDIDKTGSVEHGVQLYYDGISLEEGCKYELQFDASASVTRQVQYRTQINGGDYHAYSSEYIVLTPEPLRFSVIFTMEEPSDPAPRLCFNMGFFNNEELDAHQVIFDNFDYRCIDDSGKISSGEGAEEVNIHINQIGYRPNDDKFAVLCGDESETTFYVIDVNSGNSVFDGKPGSPVLNPNTGQKEARADFSSLKTPGTYKVLSDKYGESGEFTIAEGIYKDAFNDSLKMLYMQRCGTALDKKYAGDFAHSGCHTDKAAIYGTSEKIDVSGGWHDAGDYGRYTVSGAKAAADIMIAYEKYAGAFGDDTGIPESGNGIPDVLDEARYELEWLLKMQNKDGGVYHKVTCANFPGTVMPENETAELLVLPVSTTATGDFAAVMAMAYELYSDIDAAFASKCLSAAEKAASYLDTHNAEAFHNPSDVVTGEYPDEFDLDERFWAYAQLYRATGNKKYENALKKINLDSLKCGLGWVDVGYYGMYAYLTSDDAETSNRKSVSDKIEKCANQVLKDMENDTYGCSVTDYVWGSNMLAANNGMFLSLYADISGKDLKGKVKEHLDYLLGNNGNNYCFLTGYGSVSPVSTHHRPSQAANKTVPGMLVGGPNVGLDDPYAKQVLNGKAPALCYVDNSQSYSCNEVAIYWNSPLIYLFAECNSAG